MKKVIFGSGSAAINFLDKFSSDDFSYIIDNNSNRWGEEILGLKIFPPEKLKQENNVKVVIASSYYLEIKEQLIKEYNLIEGVNFIPYELHFNTEQSEVHNEICYPKVINFPVTNKCNFRCSMCNVWKPEHSKYKDLTAEELGKLFSNPLFMRLEHLGISGGEPFVRKDLEKVIETIVLNCPSIRSISIITNCSLKNTSQRAKVIKEFLESKGISFSIQVSIDGIGKVHDLNRGRKGAYNLMYPNFMNLLDLGIVNEISTTITKFNIKNIWDNYLFAKKNNIYIRFRLASPIARLYNEDLVENFTFNLQERLFLIKFFENIINNYEENYEKKMHYFSLINMLKGGNRLAGCKYKTSEGLSLDPYGNLHFCFPYSEKIKGLSTEERYDINLLEENKSILFKAKSNCDNCIHDYNGPYTKEGIEHLINAITYRYKVKKECEDFLQHYMLQRGEKFE